MEPIVFQNMQDALSNYFTLIVQKDMPGKEAVERSRDVFLEFQEIDKHHYASRSQTVLEDLRNIDQWRPGQVNSLEVAR
jgi:hypothetical protein